MATPNTITLDLPGDLQQYVDDKLSSGSYATPHDVVIEGLRVAREAAANEAAADAVLNAVIAERGLETLRRQIAEGVAAAEEGREVDGPTAMRALAAKHGIRCE